MIKSLVVSICIIFLCVGILNGQECNYDTKNCKIISIDSISTYYVIKAINIDVKQDTVFLLSEKKQPVQKCEKIKVGDTYQLTLKITNTLKVDEESNIILPDRNFYIDQILVCKYGILPYFVRNLVGLCY